jgi:calcium-dependent protein kinase
LPSLKNQPLDLAETKTPPFPEMHKGTEAKDILEEGGRGRSFALQALEATGQETEHGINYSETETKIVDTMSKETSITDPKTLEKLMGELKFRKGKAITKESLISGLSRLGYEVQPEEVSSLMEMLDLNKNDTIEASEFVASQIDWRDLQRNNKDLWIECARRAFEDLDSRSAGHITVENIVSSLRNKLPEEEINYAVENALVESGVMDPEQVDFEGFLKMVQMGSRASLDSLDQYDPRIRD